MLFIVVATPVEEVGRDHDFDWAVVSRLPSGLLSNSPAESDDIDRAEPIIPTWP